MVLPSRSVNDPNWLEGTSEALKYEGCAILRDVFDESSLAETRERMTRVQARIIEEVGEAKLRRAGESGVLRLMMRFDPFFFRFLEVPSLLAIIDRTVGNAAIMHLQNGFVLPSFPRDTPKTFQNTFHRDFPRWLNGYLASINAMVAVDEFSADNGATLMVPRSHTWPEPRSEDSMRAAAVPAVAPAGSLVFFDSTIFHAAGENRSGSTRKAINHQFTRSFFKQQLDYVRALDASVIASLAPRTQQLLGYWTRVPTSLDEYYRSEEDRLYRSGQG